MCQPLRRWHREAFLSHVCVNSKEKTRKRISRYDDSFIVLILTAQTDTRHLIEGWSPPFQVSASPPAPEVLLCVWTWPLTSYCGGRTSEKENLPAGIRCSKRSISPITHRQAALTWLLSQPAFSLPSLHLSHLHLTSAPLYHWGKVTQSTRMHSFLIWPFSRSNASIFNHQRRIFVDSLEGEKLENSLRLFSNMPSLFLCDLRCPQCYSDSPLSFSTFTRPLSPFLSLIHSPITLLCPLCLPLFGRK